MTRSTFYFVAFAFLFIAGCDSTIATSELRSEPAMRNPLLNRLEISESDFILGQPMQLEATILRNDFPAERVTFSLLRISEGQSTTVSERTINVNVGDRIIKEELEIPPNLNLSVEGQKQYMVRMIAHRDNQPLFVITRSVSLTH